MKTLTIKDFSRIIKSDEYCLKFLLKTRFGDDQDIICPKCRKTGKFRRLSGIPAYTCTCGHHLHPTAGTPFEGSRTSLRKWFYTFYLLIISQQSVPAKDLQRQLGVTYKCAWRMKHKIRKYISQEEKSPSPSGLLEAFGTFFRTMGGD